MKTSISHSTFSCSASDLQLGNVIKAVHSECGKYTSRFSAHHAIIKISIDRSLESGKQVQITCFNYDMGKPFEVCPGDNDTYDIWNDLCKDWGQAEQSEA
jgi:hypothetical protein